MRSFGREEEVDGMRRVSESAEVDGARIELGAMVVIMTLMAQY